MDRKSGELVSFAVGDAVTVSGLLVCPSDARACFILAHSAGAGMRHSFLEAVSCELAERKIATLRYQFPYMERGAKRPDPPTLAHAAVRAAIEQARHLIPGLALIAGGRSFGGRMTSQAQALSPLPEVRGLAFLGFPLHPAGRPSADRGKHLYQVHVPMLFLQGTRDSLAELEQLRPLMEGLSKRATLKLFPEADHSFHVPARSGRTDAEVRREIIDTLVAWTDSVALHTTPGRPET